MLCMNEEGCTVKKKKKKSNAMERFEVEANVTEEGRMYCVTKMLEVINERWREEGR